MRQAPAKITPQPLTQSGFASFGELILPDARKAVRINEGNCVRHDDLCDIQCDDTGRIGVSMFHASPRELPMELALLERHPLGSQAFMPLGGSTCCVVVAAGDDEPELASLQAFIAGPGMGFNIRRNVWHHPLIALERHGEFLVIDRVGPGANLQEHSLTGSGLVLAASPPA